MNGLRERKKLNRAQLFTCYTYTLCSIFFESHLTTPSKVKWLAPNFEKTFDPTE